MANTDNPIKKYAPLLIRIGLAAVFIVHGLDKLMSIQGTAGFFGKVGIPLPGVMAWVVAIFEFVGGLLVLVGWRTKLGATAIALVMIGAMIFVKFSKGFVGGWEFDLVLFLMAVSLLLSGPGSPSVDAIQSIDQTEEV